MKGETELVMCRGNSHRPLPYQDPAWDLPPGFAQPHSRNFTYGQNGYHARWADRYGGLYVPEEVAKPEAT
jgi:hypothetical protein